jgi:NTE family protein
MPQARFDLRNVPIIEGGVRQAEYRLRTTEYGVDLGREFSNWGELRVGVRRASGQARVRVGEDERPAVEDFDLRELYGRFSYDVLDNRNFPRRGQYLVAEWRAETPSLGSDRRADLVSFDWLLARSRGRHTGVVWTSFGTNVGSNLDTIRSLFPVGGFLNLSGLAPDSLSGRHYALARALYYRQIGRGGEGFLNLPAYAGVSLEAGNVWDRRGDISLDSALTHGSVFVGFDTLLGPVYLGSGFGEGGENTFYLFLGRTF